MKAKLMNMVESMRWMLRMFKPHDISCAFINTKGIPLDADNCEVCALLSSSVLVTDAAYLELSSAALRAHDEDVVRKTLEQCDGTAETWSGKSDYEVFLAGLIIAVLGKPKPTCQARRGSEGGHPCIEDADHDGGHIAANGERW